MMGNYSEYDPPPPYNPTCANTHSAAAPHAPPVPVFTAPPEPASTVPFIVTQNHSSTTQKGNLFCCCQLKTWTVLISLLQISFCGLRLVSLVVAALFVKFHFRISKNFLFEERNSSDLDDDEDDPSSYFTYMKRNTDPSVQAFLAFFGLIFGCLLFAGAYYGKPALLLIWWIVAATVFVLVGAAVLLFGVFLSVTMVFWGSKETNFYVMMDVIYVLILSVFYIVSLHVVCLHRRELLDDQNNTPHPASLVQYHTVFIRAS